MSDSNIDAPEPLPVKRRAFLVSSVLGTLAFLCTSDAGLASAATMNMPIGIRDAWIRWLPGDLPAGGYLTIVNSSDHVMSLLQASSADYAMVSIHQSRTVNGMAEMLPVQKIDIAPKSTLRFEATGYHLMLEHPTRKIAPGDRVTVTLRFNRGPLSPVVFEVRKPSDTGPAPVMPDMSKMPGMGH